MSIEDSETVDCSTVEETPTHKCYYCLECPTEANDAPSHPYSHIFAQYGTKRGASFLTCSTCRSHLMKLFNSNYLRDGKRLPLAIEETQIREECCVHCGTFKPSEFVKCRSELFRATTDEAHRLCKHCFDGVYTQLAITHQKSMFEIVA